MKKKTKRKALKKLSKKEAVLHLQQWEEGIKTAYHFTESLIEKPLERHSIKTRTITLPDWGANIKRGNLSLPNLIEWCEQQTDSKHQAITAWLIAARDMMDCATMAAIKQSQIDSRKKSR